METENKRELYINRYKDKILFVQVEPKLVEMTGFFEMGMRYGYPNNADGSTNKDKIVMVDPSGGPYLYAGDKLFGGVIKEFTVKEGKVLIHLE